MSEAAVSRVRRLRGRGGSKLGSAVGRRRCRYSSAVTWSPQVATLASFARIPISRAFSPVVGEAAVPARLDPGAMASVQPHVRELAERSSSGTRVRLLWRQGTGQLWVEVREPDMDQALAILVPPERALDAFHHPYAYADPHTR